MPGEMAAHLHISEGAVSTRLWHLRRMLRDIWRIDLLHISQYDVATFHSGNGQAILDANTLRLDPAQF